MARTLDATQQGLLENNPFKVERLLEIKTPAQNYFYTTGSEQVSVNTGTSGSLAAFLPANGIEVLGDINELHEINLNEIDIIIGDVGDVLYDNLTREASSPPYTFGQTDINIHLLMREPNTNFAYTTNTIPLFLGSVSKLTANRTTTTFTLNIRATNRFAQINSVNGRLTSKFFGNTPELINWGNVNG